MCDLYVSLNENFNYFCWNYIQKLHPQVLYMNKTQQNSSSKIRFLFQVQLGTFKLIFYSLFRGPSFHKNLPSIQLLKIIFLHSKYDNVQFLLSPLKIFKFFILFLQFIFDWIWILNIRNVSSLMFPNYSRDSSLFQHNSSK